MLIAKHTYDYSLLDSGGGEKLEKIGDITLQRPEPQAIWERTNPQLWHPHAIFDKEKSGGWRFVKKTPQSWPVSFGCFNMIIRPTVSKHIGVFPEQAVNWEYISSQIRNSSRSIKMLNLFAYTGGATLAALSAGAFVVHVDAAKSINGWAKENASLSGLSGAPVRFIADDCKKFVSRELRRGSKYDAIIIDPPSYGKSGNSVWKIEDDLFSLVGNCASLLSGNPLFFIINSYTTGLSSVVSRNILSLCLGKQGRIIADTLVIPQKDSDVFLPCGTTARWQP